jgi:hypothetical protein
MKALAVTLCLLLPPPLAAQTNSTQTDPALWAACIAAPEPACIRQLAEAELALDPASDEADYNRRVLAFAYLSHGDPDRASAMVRTIVDPGNALYMWREVLALRPDPADIALAVGLAAPDPANPDNYDLRGIANAVIRAGGFDQAPAVIAMMTDPDIRDAALVLLAARLAETGDPAGAAAVVDQIADPGQRDHAAESVARATQAFATGTPSGMLTAAERAESESRLISPFDLPQYNDYRAEELAGAIAALAAPESIAEALRIAATDMAPEYQAEILIATLAATGDPAVETAAVAAIDRMADLIEQASARIDLAAHLRAPAHLARLMDWAAVAGTESDRAFMLAEFAAATGLPDLAEKAVARLPAYLDNVDRRDAFTAILRATARGPEPARVANLLTLFPDEAPTADRALALSVADMARGGQAALAIRLTRDMTYDEQMAAALGRIATVTGDSALMADALIMARDVVSDVYRDQVLVQIAEAALAGP